MMKKKNVFMLVALLASATLTAGALTIHTASATTGEGFSVADFQMLEGASVRYSLTAETEEERYNDSGIRFHAVLPTTTYEGYEAAEADGTVNVSYGMIIAPYSYYKNFAEINAASVFGEGGEKKYYYSGEESADGQKQIINITYDRLEASTEVGYENYHEIKGSITKILDTNYATEFIGRAYVKYEVNGVAQYDFAEYLDGDASNTARSAAYVAQLAEEQNLDYADWLKTTYLAPVTTQATTYTVETYVGDTCVKTEKRDATINQTLTDVKVKEYEGFEVVDAEVTGKVYANGRLTLKHVYQEIEGLNYQVKNGDFETGDLTDWTLNGNIGAVSSETNYWRGDALSAEGFPFGLDGTYMFSAYEGAELEKNKGTLTSSTFTVSESGWITYKLGGAKNNLYVYIDVVEAVTGKILHRYSNQNHKYEVVDGVQLGCELNAYKANLQDCIGKEVYLRVSDFGSSGFGLFFLDSVDTLHLAEPQEGFTLASEVEHQATIYDLYNGNFDKGMDGWVKAGDIGDIRNNSTYWETRPFENVGNFFSAYDPDVEGGKGTLTSNVFEIGGCGYITYRIGGIKNPDQVYMEVIDAVTGVKYGHFYNEFINDCTLVSYKADLSAYIGKLVYINFVDNATGDYGLIFCDEFVTYYENVEDVPAYNVAGNKVESIYNVMNGGFETGNLLGWTLVSGEVPGRVTDIDYFWNDVNRVIGKDGNYSFTGVEINPDNGNLEGLTGTLRSNTFVLKASSSISFKMGGSGADRQDVCLRIVNALTGEVVVWYSNPDFRDATLNAYTYDISNATDMVCYVEIVDNATSNWGLLGLDSINVFQK